MTAHQAYNGGKKLAEENKPHPPQGDTPATLYKASVAGHSHNKK